MDFFFIIFVHSKQTWEMTWFYLPERKQKKKCSVGFKWVNVNESVELWNDDDDGESIKSFGIREKNQIFIPFEWAHRHKHILQIGLVENIHTKTTEDSHVKSHYLSH